MKHTIHMVMTHITTDGRSNIADVQVGEADSLEAAKIKAREVGCDSCCPSKTIAQLRQLVFQFNPQAVAVRTEFIIRF